MLEDTIIAISTPAGYGGLGIVRLSGETALGIAKKIFKSKKKGEKILPRCLVLGEIYDRERKESIDEAYLVFFPKPRSYTRENVVEISCHGSPFILEEVVRLGIRAGARPAHPGEFTLRAFLRGRIDVLQAEAVNDLITATSLKQARISFGQLKGKLSRKVEELRRKIIQVLGRVEAAIEFPEDGLPLGSDDIERSLKQVIAAIRRLIESYEAGRTMTEGLTLAIVGKANVGKSTLFNALLDEERAIVSPYPGTTRDYLRERITIEGSFFQLVDMAGLDRPSHPVEEEGIKKGLELASQADGVLLVLDSSHPENQADLRLVRKYRNKKAIFLFNKCDLPERIDKDKCRALTRQQPWLDISALNGTNLGKLKEMIHRAFVPEATAKEEVILHQRQKFLLEQALVPLERSLKLVDQGYTEELVAEEIRLALPPIGGLTGEIRADDVIDSIFSRFCVGK
jgi:tRNA modification GTPase